MTRHLLCFRADPDVGAAALSRAAQTRPGVSGHHPYGAAAISPLADRPGVLSRFTFASVQGRAKVAAGRFPARGIPGDSDCRAMALLPLF